MVTCEEVEDEDMVGRGKMDSTNEKEDEVKDKEGMSFIRSVRMKMKMTKGKRTRRSSQRRTGRRSTIRRTIRRRTRTGSSIGATCSGHAPSATPHSTSSRVTRRLHLRNTGAKHTQPTTVQPLHTLGGAPSAPKTCPYSTQPTTSPATHASKPFSNKVP